MLYTYFFNAEFPSLTVKKRSYPEDTSPPWSLPSSHSQDTTNLNGYYKRLHIDSSNRKAYYVWLYYPKVNNKKNPNLTPASQATDNHFSLSSFHSTLEVWTGYWHE